MFNALFVRRAWIAQVRRHCIAIASSALIAGPAFAAAPTHPLILVVGDSISAEYGLRRDTGWVKLLEQRLADSKIDATVVNASISGDTTSGGRSRLSALLDRHHPNVVVLELGANDALRGLPVAETSANLTALAQASKQAGAQVVIVGIQVPPNYGRRYTEEFGAVFGKVASAEQTALVPFLLKGVADAPEPMRWFQADRIHPKEEAQPLLLNNVWPVLEPLLRGKLASKKPAKSPAQ